MIILTVNFRRSVIIVELWRPEVARPVFEHFLRFFGKKRPLMVKVFKILIRKFSSPHRSTLLCSNVVKKFSTGNRQIVHYLTDENNFRLPLKLSLLRGSCLKICQGQPPTFGLYYSRFHRNRFTFGGVTAERVKAVHLPHRVLSWWAFRPYDNNSNNNNNNNNKLPREHRYRG